MGVDTAKYIRKPLYVDAVRVTPQNFDELASWCQGEIGTDESPDSGIIKKYIKVRVHQPKNLRQTKAFVGDWLLYTERGYKVYTHKAFLGSFDLVEEDVAGASGDIPRDNADNPVGAAKELEGADEEITADEIEGLSLENGQPVESAVEEHTTPQGEPHEYVEATPEAIAEVVNEEQPRDNDGLKPIDQIVEEGQQPVEEATPIAPPPTPAIIPPEASPEPVSEQPPEEAAAGKRVLSETEQQQMGPDAVREAVSSGEVILAQDLAETP